MANVNRYKAYIKNRMSYYTKKRINYAANINSREKKSVVFKKFPKN